MFVHPNAEPCTVASNKLLPCSRALTAAALAILFGLATPAWAKSLSSTLSDPPSAQAQHRKDSRESVQTGSPIDTLLEHHHYLRAQGPIRAALARNPNDPTALIQLSIDEWALTHYDAAIAAAQRATELAPSSARAFGQLANALGAKLASSSAGSFEKLSLAHRFRKAAEQALALDPNEVEALQDLARFYYTAPGFAGGDKAKARQTADHLFAVDPYLGAVARANFVNDADDPTAGDLGYTAPPVQGPKQTAELIAIWRVALEQRPDSYRIHAALAATALAGGPTEYALAEAEATRARAIDPTQVQAYKTLAVVDVRTGNWRALATTIEQAIVSIPDDRTPEYLAASAILTAGAASEYPLAERYLRDYLAEPAEGHEPSAAEAHWRLGLVLEREGRRADAVHEFQRAVELDGSLEQARADLKRLT